MKFCSSCGKQLSDDIVFCPFCGANQAAQRSSQAPLISVSPQVPVSNNYQSPATVNPQPVRSIPTIKEYAIEQRRFNEKVFGRGTRSIDSVEGLLNKYAREGWRLHTMMTAPTRDEKTQLTTMVFERDIPAPGAH